MRKVVEQYEGTAGPNARGKQKNEFYSVIKPLTLAKLLEPCMEQEESIYKIDADEVASMASGVSSVVLKDDKSVAGGDGNLLILDCRSFEQYDACHVYGAMHYDRTDLSKATNNFPREVYFYKGSVESDKMVLLYDADGKSLTQVANSFVEKGVENTYVLAGGIEGVTVRCPHILQPPPPASSIPPLAAALANRSGGASGRVAALDAQQQPAQELNTRPLLQALAPRHHRNRGND
eukprot:CAMPEP_0119333984 /NCGR_PEP_ID=MMETSP1333-20130426/86392_1 /TAXON_ID=418940 /ORGANISM="Scyphosphaera apsteinii, Strain RCC1455" /LENGTH=234 /DNA_ID=CAMNT_0007344187 /DNA_START=8 /DNA_END=713 /DNA_ORIENTATION=-